MFISRTPEKFKTVFGIELATGGVCHILQKMKHKAQPAYESIRQLFLQSTVIGGDETGVNINSDNHWAWASQNPEATYIAINKKRGYSAIDEIHRTFTVLFKEPAAGNVKDIITFQNRMIKYEDYVFAFIDNPEIPPDNNGSERAIINFKVKQKVSGFFKSIEGSNAYAVLRSVIDTAIQYVQNPYLAIQQVAQYNYATE